MTTEQLVDRSEHDLGRRRGDPRHVHAGRLRVPRGRADADEERRPHRGEERARRSASPRSSTTSSASGSRSATAATASSAAAASLPDVDTLLAIGAEPFSWFATVPAAGAYLFQVVFAAVSLAIVWGAMAERTKLWVYFAFGIVFTLIYSVVCALDLASRRLALREGDAGLRRLDGRALPGRPRGTRRGAAARARASASSAATASRTRSRATTWPTRRSA